MDIPVCTYEISIEIDTQELVRLCKELSIIGDVGKLNLNSDDNSTPGCSCFYCTRDYRKSNSAI